MPRKRKPQLPCKGCGAVIDGRRRLFCTPKCGDQHAGKVKGERALEARKAKRAQPRICGNPSCLAPFTGNLQKLYCSSRCNQLVNHKRPTIEYERALRAKRTAKNIEKAGICSICKGTLARGAYYRVKPNPMVPEGIDLCKRHARGYQQFITWNEYDTCDMDEVFAAYLIHQSFSSSLRQPYMVMLRESIHRLSSGSPSNII